MSNRGATQARMTRTKNTPLSYEPHSVGGEDSDRTGGIETMLQHPVYNTPDWLASLRATRTRYRITLRHAAKLLGMPPSELSGIERGEFQTTPDEVRIFMNILKHGDERENIMTHVLHRPDCNRIGEASTLTKSQW